MSNSIRPKALDLFCGAGGASMGLYRAGFDVVGVDIKPQPRYPFRFHRADALAFPLEGYDFIWASPPCQAYTAARTIHGRKHPELIEPTRARLEASGTAWCIENVPGAPLRHSIILCGSMFGERRLIRHRLFELSWEWFELVPPCSHGPVTVSVFGHGGHVYNGVAEWKDVMGIDWMNRDELAQAIPPAYGEFIGRAALKQLSSRVT